MMNQNVRPDEEQVFLMMGLSQTAESAECAIVMAPDLASAKRAFEKNFKGFVPMTWPSLREIRQSVDMMETARDGGFPDEVPVINALASARKGWR